MTKRRGFWGAQCSHDVPIARQRDTRRGLIWAHLGQRFACINVPLLKISLFPKVLKAPVMLRRFLKAPLNPASVHFDSSLSIHNESSVHIEVKNVEMMFHVP